MGSQTQGPTLAAVYGPSGEALGEPRTKHGRELLEHWPVANSDEEIWLRAAILNIEDEASALAESVTWQIALQQALTGDLRERE